MKTYPYMILGGGLVAGYAATAFVENGLQPGELCILSAEAYPPYERPPLSKGFLAGKSSVDELLIHEVDYYTEHGIELRLNSPVQKLDFQNKRVQTAGETIGFGKLLLATGSRVRSLDLPGAEAEGIYYLRQIEDAERIRSAAADSINAVVIGGSFIGLEVSSVLSKLEVETTLVFPSTRVWEKLFTTRMANFFERYYQDHGVTLIKETKVTGFSTSEHGRHQVSLSTGKELVTDMVVVGVGVAPNVQLFKESALELDNGVVVNRYLETNITDVYAAGDIARYRDALYGDKLRRIEHWDNAMSQGQHAARVMLGMREEFIHVPYFFSDVFDLSYEYWGDAESAVTVVHRGDVDSGSFSTWWLNEAGALVAAFVMDRPDEERTLAPRWIKEGKQLNAAHLKDSDRPLETIGESVA